MTNKVTTKQPEDIKIIVFTLFNERMGIDLSNVREVIAPAEIHPLPNTPEFIEGVIILRKHAIAVIDLRKKFHLSCNQSEDLKINHRIIICKLKNFIIGLIVDDVQEIVSINKNQLETMPSIVLSKNEDSHILGISTVDEQVITILDIEYILSSEEKSELSLIKK